MEVMTEEWRPVAEFPAYEVSNCGRVRRLGKTECLRGGSGKSKYLQVQLGAGNPRYVHKLVATTWIENPEVKLCVDHIDGDRLNNHVSNLRWATHSENQRNRRSNLTYKGVCRNHLAKKWVAHIKINRRTISLGYYDDALEAYYVYCAAAVFYFGDFACG